MSSSVEFENSQPILRVDDLKASVDFYVNRLGFHNAEWAMDEFTYVTRGKAGIYLCQQGQGLGGAWIWIGVSDVRALRAELAEAGVAVRMEPTNFPWALEIHVEDPDGNVIRFGSEPE